MKFDRQDVNGVKIHYGMAGDGPPLVLLHGSPETSLAWRKVIPALAEDYTVVTPDLRGYGLSDKPATGYDIREMAEDVRQLIRHLGLGPVNVVGHDLGGLIGYAYAAQYMSDVRRLGVIEAPILGVPSPVMDGVVGSYWHFGLYAHPRLAELLIAGREREYLAEFIRTYRYIDGIDDDALDEYAQALASPGGVSGLVGVYREMAVNVAAIAQITAQPLTMPVWAVGGEHSMGAGPHEQFEQLATTVTGTVIADCGHWVPEEQPAQLLVDLRAFLK